MKHHSKVKKALEFRQSHTPNDRGFRKPGSMNKRKTGFFNGKR